MNRSSKLAVLVALAVGSAPALALNLGQIQVKSALDRPLVAVIPLHEDFPGEANHLTVTLAPAAAFTRAGISRANLKVPLTFKVVTNAKGQKVIRVTSKAPVREPYLDFLVQVTWPKGKLLREYVVLLDPLSMSAAPPVVPASAPPAAAPAARPPAATTQAPVPAAASAPAAPSAAAGAHAHVYGPVKPGDTLSRIAQTHAITGVSYQQMLIALKTTNPDAFFRNNVNALMAGAILRIPTRTQALAVTTDAAIAAVRQQNQAWRGAQASAPTLVASAGGSSAPVNGSASAGADSDRLKLVPPKAGSGSAGVSSGGAQATVTQLRQDLARNQEALSSQKQASADLTSRVNALQQIADKNKRLLGLKNAQIAALQDKLAQARKAAGLPAAASVPVPAGAAVASAASTMPAAAASTGSMAAVAAAGSATHVGSAMAAAPDNATGNNVSAQAAKASAANQPHPARPAPAHNTPAAAVPWYQQLWARVALAIIIILLLIAWFVQRRRRGPGKSPKPSLADNFGNTPFGRDADAMASADSMAVGEDDTSPVYTVDDDGEDELLAQLSEHPDSVDMHLELVSLYYARGDVAQFENAAEAMRPHVIDDADPEWQEVVAMGRELSPDHALFAHADVAEAADAMAGARGDMESDQEWHAESAEPGTDAPVEEYTVEEPPAPSAYEVPEFETPSPGMPDESEFDALPPLPDEGGTEPVASEADSDPAKSADETDFAPAFDTDDAPSSTAGEETGFAPAFGTDDAQSDASDEQSDLAPALGTADPDQSLAEDDESDAEVLSGGFTDDPVDTKLDLARAYMDMGDHDGAQAMLTEALNEGSQAQKEMAEKLLDELA